MIVTLALAYFTFYLLDAGGSISVTPTFWSYLLCGVLWGLSLIIPGLASSGIMIYLGLYEPMNAGIGALNFSVIIPLLLGVAASVSLFARLVNMLFKCGSASLACRDIDEIEESLEEALTALDGLGIPGSRLLEIADKHFVKSHSVRAKVANDIVGIHDVAA